MATYKLIQDIEAEDHILGPLSLRQFVFALIAAFLFYICFILITKHVLFMLIVFVPPALFCAFFAIPFGGDQPTELWALAKLRFWFKPRKRLWNQSGVKELVTITVPKKIEHIYSDGLSQTQVKSRLQVLANTIDSRGWAVKHIDATGYLPQQLSYMHPESDRLLEISSMPQEVPNSEPPNDIMDTDTPIARQFDTMITKSSQEHRQRLVDALNGKVDAAFPTQPADNEQWFMSHNPVTAAPAPVAPAAPPAAAGPSTPDDAMLSSQLRAQSQSNSQQAAYGNLRTLQPTGVKLSQPADSAAPVALVPDNTLGTVTAASDPAILSLAKNNDLNVSTLAREANKAKLDGSQDEVVISLH